MRKHSIIFGRIKYWYWFAVFDKKAITFSMIAFPFKYYVVLTIYRGVTSLHKNCQYSKHAHSEPFYTILYTTRVPELQSYSPITIVKTAFWFKAYFYHTTNSFPRHILTLLSFLFYACIVAIQTLSFPRHRWCHIISSHTDILWL